jgi:eukaryotic-like serine/threonine-protein kinase
VPERFLGRTLGKFRIDAIVGTGGFAWVYKAFDPELEVPVALKVLKPQYAGDEQFEQRFRREAATAARLRHPNIIKIFAVGKDGPAVYFAMDFLPQGLPDRLEVIGKMPEPVLIRMGIDVASALGFAHREGVVHRDIKVDNILFDDHGNAIVADFGIARAVSNYIQQTGTNMVVGTPQYFSPEQARGMALDGRADIYSLGVTLYRAATGVLPFTGDDWYEIARQHVEDKPVKPRVHNSVLSRDIDRLIMRCLEKDPAARFQTGESLCQALGALSFERNETIAMRSTPSLISSNTPTAKNAWRGLRATPLRRLTAGVATIAVLGALVWGGIHLTRHSGDPGGGSSADSADARPNTPLAAADPTGTGSSATTASASNGPDVPAASAAHGPAGTDVTPRSGALPTAPAKAGGSTASRHKRSSSRSTQSPGHTPTSHPPAASSSVATTPHPRGSGTVLLDAIPSGASYTLQALDGGRVIKGTMPISNPLSLPVGDYAIEISARYCASYRDTLRVPLNRAANPVHVKLVCGIN